LLPLHNYSGCFRFAQRVQNAVNKLLLPRGRTVRDVFDCFRLPAIADKIRQQRHEGDTLTLRELGKATICVDPNVPRSVNHRQPLGAQMSDEPGMLFE